MGMRRKYIKKNNVLMVNITRLGDMLQATPTIAGIKMENPDCKVTVLVEKQFSAICDWLPHIDDVVALDLGMTVRSLASGSEGIIDAYTYVGEVVEDLKSRGFDYCLNMSSSAYTALLLSLIGVKRHGGWTADEEGYRVIESDWAKLFATSVFHQNRQFNSINLVDVFRCSSDTEQHPKKLLINIDPDATKYCEGLVREAGFTNTGPLIAVQAGASQGKRQWATERFVKLVRILIDRYQARVILTGTKKEMRIIEPIASGVNSPNVFVAAGRTNIPQLAALLKMSAVLVTGDTGPMHIAVAAGTPVVSMFLASAYGFETGPYSEGNLVLQPVLSCAPCNPNKPCSRPDCHDQIDPEFLAELVMKRVEKDIRELSDDFADPAKIIVYRSCFDQYGFCNFEALNSQRFDRWRKVRNAYRKVWLKDLAGYEVPMSEAADSPLEVLSDDEKLMFEGLDQVLAQAQEGIKLIQNLTQLVGDPYSSTTALRDVNKRLSELDREIEQTGFHYAPLNPVTRMFLFAKENIVGTEALSLASQMGGNYQRLEERCKMLAGYYRMIS
ncbi:MAG: glycosyltransferase family 9 protein [Deltaproteobacteria bacterium]|nr:glycosyltransferase family 9 protein [Deltaproteobacteria bacterium]